MQIVIDISEQIKATLNNENEWSALLLADLKEIVNNGTPLPKGHGRLIDADNLKENVCKWLKPSVPDESMLVDIAEVGANVCKEIEEQPTIIEANKDGD